MFMFLLSQTDLHCSTRKLIILMIVKADMMFTGETGSGKAWQTSSSPRRSTVLMSGSPFCLYLVQAQNHPGDVINIYANRHYAKD